VLIALAMGDQQAIGHRWWEIFNRTGVGHLMSISGLHITMLAALAMGLARRALRLPTGLNRRLLARCPGPWLHWGFGVSVAFVYAGIAGWGIPAQRTCWMLLLTALAVLSGRCRGILAILGLAAAVVTLIDPWAPTAAGFWLSFVAVAAIAVYGSSRRLRSVADDAQALTSPGRAGLGDRLDRLLREAVASQWAATLSLLPLSALFFSSVSLVSPLANAFAIPLVSILITPLVLAYAMMALLMPGLAQGLSVVLIAPTEALLFALEFLSRWPYASWVLPRPDPFVLGLSALGVFMLLRPHPVPMRPAWAFTLLPLFLGGAELPGPGGIRVHALDVGQGSAVLIEANGFRMLFDAGPLWSADSNAGQRIVAPWLRARGVRRIDLLVVSHPDLDHAGGVLDVLRSVKVDAVISSIPSGHPFRIDHPNHRSCRRGDLWRQAAVEIEILHPGDEMPPGAARSPTNARSCVMRLRTTAGSVLLTGDLEARQEHDLVNRYGADRLAADVMIVPHHGSNTSSTEAWLAAVAPRWAVIQSGYRNRFGHPKPKVLDRYERAGIVVFRNDLHGAISIELAQGQSPTITKSRVDRAPYWRLK
jgi:competence protein ComEC